MRSPATAGVIVVFLVASIVAGGIALFNALRAGYLGQFFRPHTVMMLDLSVELLERHKDNEGRYPDALDSAKEYLRDGEIFPDMDFMGPLKLGERVRHFYYETEEHGQVYYLFGIGLDGEPFTDDDVYPTREATENSDGFKKPEINANKRMQQTRLTPAR